VTPHPPLRDIDTFTLPVEVPAGNGDGGARRALGLGRDPGNARRRPAAALVAAALALAAACGRDSTGPANPEVRLAVAGGDDQFLQPGLDAELPLRVRVTDADRGSPVTDLELRWRVVRGAGATLSDAEASDEIGIAGITLRAGPDTGEIRVEAAADRLIGQPATFRLRAVRPPMLASMAPATAAAGTDVLLAGAGFSPVASDNTVLFGGLRGAVRSATATTIIATVPGCVLDRNTDVRVALGPVSSNAIAVRTVAGSVQPVSLAHGRSLRLTDPAAFACLDLSSAPAGAEFLVVAQDASSALDLPLRYEILGLTGGLPVTLPPLGGRRLPTRDFASDWEWSIRERERVLGPPGPVQPGPAVMAVRHIPALGDSREFNVLTPDQKSRAVTASVRAISDRAILYVDAAAPANGFTAADLEGFGRLFDDPIYTTDIAAFGPLSDIDDNDRVIVLFTPAVNALTPRQQSGFIAGYFYGCDLLPADRCRQTNRGEIFYAVVPDPTGQFGDARSKSAVLRTVPAVLAHELQHMINFSRRNGTLDVLWLAEGMAHAAEDLVADVFAQRGDAQNADDFRRPNHVRAQFYLRSVASTSRVDIESPGSLEMRGGAWLFIKYIAGHHGGSSLLERLTGASSSGAQNVTAATGRTWTELSSDFAVALFADGAPELAGATVDPRLGFADFDLRSALAALAGGFPVLGTTVAFQDFLLSGELPSAAQAYLVLRVPAGGGVPFRFAFSGPRGGPFEIGTPVLSLLRLR